MILYNDVMVLLFDRGTSTAAARRIAHSDWLGARLHLRHETQLNHPTASRHLLDFNTNNFLDADQTLNHYAGQTTSNVS